MEQLDGRSIAVYDTNVTRFVYILAKAGNVVWSVITPSEWYEAEYREAELQEVMEDTKASSFEELCRRIGAALTVGDVRILEEGGMRATLTLDQTSSRPITISLNRAATQVQQQKRMRWTSRLHAEVAKHGGRVGSDSSHSIDSKSIGLMDKITEQQEMIKSLRSIIDGLRQHQSPSKRMAAVDTQDTVPTTPIKAPQYRGNLVNPRARKQETHGTEFED